MSSKSKKTVKTNFALQATILAAASIISKLIGMVYNIPFVNILNRSGEGYGNAYYGSAQTWYFYILVIATFSIPSAVSKIMAERIKKGEYKNVKRIFDVSKMYVAVVGLVAACVAFFGAPRFVTENTVLSLRVLAPTIFLSGFLSVYRGYFQAYGNMVPTSISQVIEQIFNAIGSISVALLFIHWATNNRSISEVDKFGAAGGTIGTGIALVAGLIYMMIKFSKEKKELNVRIKEDTTKEVLSNKEVLRLLLLIATPIIMSSAIYNSNTMLDQTLFQKLSVGKDVIEGQWGLYIRIYTVLANVPIAMATAVASAIIPSMSSAYSVGDKAECNRKLGQSLQLTMVMTIPCAVGFAVLGKQIVRLLFYTCTEEQVNMIGMMLLIGGISIIVYGISNVFNGVLQGIGKVNVPVISALIALVLHVAVLITLIKVAHLEIFSVLFATILYGFVVIILNYRYLKKELGYKMAWKEVFYGAGVAAIIMGVVAVGAYYALDKICLMFAGARVANAIAVLVAIALAALTYFAALIKVGGFDENALMTLPKGALLARMAKKLHLIK